MNRYLKDISKFDPVSREIERVLLVKAKNGNTQAFNTLIQSNLKFVIRTAKKYQGQGISLNDLVAEGNIGLLKAFDRFDVTRKNIKFITYAVWWIRQTILNAIHENAKLIRLPLNKISNVTKISKATELLRETLSREPTDIEIADYLENPDILKDLKYAYVMVGLNTPHTEDGKDLNSVISSNEIENLGSLEEEFRKELDDILISFPEREKIIIHMYYGIGYVRAYTLKEIGEEFKLTRERIRQIKEKVLKKLRLRHRKEKLRLYL